MSQPATLLEKVLTLLAPLFLAAAGGDIAAAREAVRASLAEYNARTDGELRLVALLVAFDHGALEALGQAAAAGLSINQVMRLRGNAVSLSRAADRTRAELEKRQAHAPEAPAVEAEPAETELPVSLQPADLATFARKLAAALPLTRQQRRAADRAAEKARHQQDHQARRAARSGLNGATH